MSDDLVSPKFDPASEITVFSELYLAGRKPQVGASREFYALLAQHPDLFRSAVEVVRKTTDIRAPRPSYEVEVDGTLSPDDLIRKAGFQPHDFPRFYYELRCDGIKRHITVEMFRFWRNKGSDVVIQELREIGFRPLDMAELLALKGQAPAAFSDRTETLALNQLFDGHCLSIGQEGDNAGFRNYLGTLHVKRSIPHNCRIPAVKLKFN